MKKITANNLTQYVIRLGLAHGFTLWRNNNMATYDPKRKAYRKHATFKKGIFDVIGFQKKTGRHAEFEIKVGKDKMSLYQEQHLQELTANNCYCEIFTTPEDADDYFNRLETP